MTVSVVNKEIPGHRRSTHAVVHPNMRDYYRDKHVQRRMAEFLGGRTLQDATCVWVGRSDRSTPNLFDRRPAEDISRFSELGLGISRSLWDRKSPIAHLDVEYVNFDFPAEPFLDLERSFELQTPVVRTLLSLGLHPRHVAGLIRSKYDRPLRLGVSMERIRFQHEGRFFPSDLFGTCNTRTRRTRGLQLPTNQRKRVLFQFLPIV